MNTVALGFVGTPRAGAPRDSYFTGTSNNPSKKGSMIAVAVTRPKRDSVEKKKVEEPASYQAPVAMDSEITVPRASDASMLERRCQFLEQQGKRQITMLADQNEHISSLEHRLFAQQLNGSFGWLHANVLQRTTEYMMQDTDEETPNCEAGGATVEKGVVVNVCYPMKEIGPDDTRILMTRRCVEPTTGQLKMSWIVVYTRAVGEDVEGVRCVGNFTLA